MGVLRQVQVAVVLAVGVLASVRAAAQQPPEGAALQLELLREETQSVRPLFKLELHNRTTRPLILHLGMNVGGKNYAGEVNLELKDASGRTRRLVKRDLSYIEGAVGPYVVTVPGGGTFELPGIDLVDYWSYEPKIAILALPEGSYSLSAEYRGHNPNDDVHPAPGQPPFHQYTQDFWIGNVRSNVVVFTLATAIGDPHAR